MGFFAAGVRPNWTPTVDLPHSNNLNPTLFIPTFHMMIRSVRSVHDCLLAPTGQKLKLDGGRRRIFQQKGRRHDSTAAFISRPLSYVPPETQPSPTNHQCALLRAPSKMKTATAPRKIQKWTPKTRQAAKILPAPSTCSFAPKTCRRAQPRQLCIPGVAGQHDGPMGVRSLPTPTANLD
jgi:hypothetical protein